MSVEMRKVGGVWVRPDAVEAITLDVIDNGGRGIDHAVLWMAGGSAHSVAASPDEVVAILASDPVRSWGSLDEIPRRPRYEGTVPRD